MISNAKFSMQQRPRHNIYTKNETWNIMLHNAELIDWTENIRNGPE